MNEKNFDYLKDQIKFTGFGEGLENELKDKMQKQTPEFQITHKAKFGNDDLVDILHLKNLIRLICIFSIVIRSA